MKTNNKSNFIKAMVKEVEYHVSRKYWEIVPISEVPKDHQIIDTVWSFKRKRDIVSQKTVKRKVRLAVHGGQHQYDLNFWDTYSPVSNWFFITYLSLSQQVGVETSEFYAYLSAGTSGV